jgi:hypothetical protein
VPDNISAERRATMEREKANQKGGRAGWYETKNLTDDVIRLLPLRDTDPIGTNWTYYFLNNKAYTCPEETFGQPSIVAKAIRALEKLGHEQALLMVKALKDARRAKVLMKIISRRDPTTPKWFEAPFAIYKVAFDSFDKDGLQIWKMGTGYDLRISKTGAAKQTKYTAAVRPESCPLADTQEQANALRDAAYAMDPSKIVVANEAGALEALKAVIAPGLWAEIAHEVVGGSPAPASSASRAARAPSPSPISDDGDAPSSRAGGAIVDDEGDAIPPKAAAAAPARRAAAAVVDDGDAPAPAARTAAAPATRAARAAVVADDEEGAARTPANKRTTAAVVADDAGTEAPAGRAAPAAASTKRHQIVDDE